MLTARFRNSLIAALASSLLASCASTQPSAAKDVDPSLTEECPPLSLLADGNGPTVLRWILATVDAYNDCATSKKRLAEAVR